MRLLVILVATTAVAVRHRGAKQPKVSMVEKTAVDAPTPTTATQQSAGTDGSAPIPTTIQHVKDGNEEPNKEALFNALMPGYVVWASFDKAWFGKEAAKGVQKALVLQKDTGSRQVQLRFIKSRPQYKEVDKTQWVPVHFVWGLLDRLSDRLTVGKKIRAFRPHDWLRFRKDGEKSVATIKSYDAKDGELECLFEKDIEASGDKAWSKKVNIEDAEEYSAAEGNGANSARSGGQEGSFSSAAALSVTAALLAVLSV